MVDADVDDPVAQPGRRARLGLHVVVVERRVGLVRRAGELAHELLVLGEEVVLVEGLERREEARRVAHRLLHPVPAHVELLEVGALLGEHVADGGRHVEHLGGRRAQALELGERALVETVERGLGLLNRGLGGRQVSLALPLEGRDLRLHLGDLLLLDGGILGLLVGDGRFLADLRA